MASLTYCSTSSPLLSVHCSLLSIAPLFDSLFITLTSLHVCFALTVPAPAVLNSTASHAYTALYISCSFPNEMAANSSIPRTNSASPSSILHFIRSSPSPIPPHPPTACPTCHYTPTTQPQQLPAYSLYAHGLSSVSPPAVLLHHVLPSPPPLLAHTSLASQHPQSADSAHNQLIDAPYILTAMPALSTGAVSTGTLAHGSKPRPSQFANSASSLSSAAAPHFRSQPSLYQPYHYPLPAPHVAYHPQAADCPSPLVQSHPSVHSAASPYLHDRDVSRRSRRRLSDEEEQLSYFKTEVCRTHLTSGVCQFGVDCQFAHSFDELRPREYDSKYKTELCKRYHTLGASGCKFGVRCKFLHDEVRIKASDGEYWLCSETEAIIRVEVVPTHHYHRRQLLDQLTFFPPTGPVSPLSTSPIPPRRPRRAPSPPPYVAEYATGGTVSQLPSLTSLPAFLAAAVSPAHSVRSVPVSGLDSGSTSTGSSDSGGGGGSGMGGGVSYSTPARYRRVGDGEYVLSGDGRAV